MTTVSTTDVTLLLCLSLNQAHAESCCPIPSERNHRSPTRQKRKNLASTFVQELDNPATEHREASSDYFALVPVNQLDEIVSQSMIP